LHRALVPLYLALERTDEALAACKKALELNPDDYRTGFLYARQLRGLNRNEEAREVLAALARSKALKARADLAAQAWFDLAVLHEQGSDWKQAESCYRQVARLLDDPASLLEHGAVTREEIAQQAGETWERIGRVCLKARRADQAVEAYRTAQKK